MFKKGVLLTVLALALPLAAFATSIDVTNHNGTITGSSAGLSLSGSVMISYGSIIGSNLGSVTFSTLAFTSGNAQMGGTLAAGGSFTITGNGSVPGLPNGVIFTGTFTSATWTRIDLSNGTHTYQLSGAVMGSNGVAATTQLTVNTGTDLFNGSAQLSSGDTSLTLNTAAVPEPGTLSLFGTGLIGLVVTIRRRWRLA